jgi:hypothetical protein
MAQCVSKANSMDIAKEACGQIRHNPNLSRVGAPQVRYVCNDTIQAYMGLSLPSHRHLKHTSYVPAHTSPHIWTCLFASSSKLNSCFCHQASHDLVFSTCQSSMPMTHQERLPAHQLIMAAQPSAEHHTLQPVDVNQQGVRAAAHVTRAS